MKRWAWKVLLAAAVLASLSVGVFAAAPLEDDNFTYVELSDGSLEVQTYKEAKRGDRKQSSVAIPAMYDGKAVTSIGTYAFGGKDANDPQSEYLEFITIPNSVDHIASNAFTGASALDSIEIPGGVVIDDHAFQNSQNVRSIIIHDDVNDRGEIDYRSAKIGKGAFQGCKNLQKVTLPSSILTISENAFSGCSELKEIVIPYSVQTIQKNAFAECNSLRSIIFCRSDVKFVDIDNKDVVVAAVFPTLSKVSYIHCLKDSEMYSRFYAAVKKLAPAGTADADAYAAERVHPIQMNPAQEKPENLSDPNKRCKDFGTDGTITTQLTCLGYDVTVETEVTKDDGSKETVTTTEHKDCGSDLFKSSSYKIERKVSAPYHKPEEQEEQKSTCVEHGHTDIIACSVCGTLLSSTELPLANHTYNSDSETDKRDLFTVRCDSPADKKGLILVTKRCAICGEKGPTCWECEELIWKLEEANAGLDSARADLADKTAKAEAAKNADEAAQADLTAADEALEAAKKAETDAQTADNDAADKVTEAQAALDGLGADASESELADAQKALDEATAKKADTAKALLAAQRDVAQKEINQEKAKTEASETEKARKDAEQARDAAQAVIDNDATLSNAQDALRDHVTDNTAGVHGECAECAKLLADIRAAGTNATKKDTAEKAYEDHKKDTASHKPTAIPANVISGETVDVPAHDWGEPEVPTKDDQGNDIKIPECGSGQFIKIKPTHTCKVCRKTEPTGEETILDAADAHKPPANVEIDEEKSFPAVCGKEGKRVYKDYVCEICGATVTGGEEVLPALEHHFVYKPELDEITKEPSCLETGLKNTYQVCDNPNCPLDGKPQLLEKDVPINSTPEGHDWGDFVPGEGQDTTQLEDCHEKSVTGTVKCKNCGTVEERTITIPGKADHTWGEWTLDADGKTEHRTCKVCGKTEKRDAAPKPDDPCKDGHKWGEWVLSADGKTETRTCQVCGKTETRDATTKPDEPSPDTEYTITVVQGAGGTITVSRTSAKKGTSVTITVRPDSGYELDMVRVIGDTTAEDLTGSRRSFIMPASNVKVQASFTRISSGTGWGGVPNDGSGYNRSDPTRTQPNTPVQIVPNAIPQAGSSGQLFWDVPSEHWAAGEIAWASEMEYMSGSNGMFNPNEPINAQQMWMVLARINGTYPSDMVEARRWAVLHGFADASSPTSPVTRQQLMTALYRCAYLKGAVTRSNGSLAGYRDSRLVPAVARDAFVWGVSNGIITGDSSNCLRPSGVVSRAEFAVFLYRFDLRV